MSTARLIAWNTGVQAIGKVVSTLFGVGIIALMTRYLGQEGFGYYSTANAFFQILAIMLDLGINVTLVQMLGERAGDEKYENRAVSATMTFRIVTAFVLLGSAPFVGLLFPYAWEVKVALFAIWVSFFSASLNQIVIGVQQRHLKMSAVAISEVAGRAFLFIGLLVCMALGWGLIPVVIFVSFGSSLNLLINWLVARRYASFDWNWDPDFWKTMLQRSWPIGVSILFNLAYFKADAFILSLVRSASEVGLYSAAYRVLEILITFPFMLAGLVLPLMANAWAKKEPERLNTLVRQSMTAMALIAVPLAAGVAVIGTQAMRLIAGPDFTASGDVLKILSLATAIIYLGTVASHVVVAVNAQRKMLPIYAIAGVLTVLGYMWLIPIYGMWAAAWLTVASELVVAVAAMVITLKAAPRGLDFWNLLKILAAGAIMMLCILPLKDMWLPIPIIAGAAVYSALILITGAVSRGTLKELLSAKKGETIIETP